MWVLEIISTTKGIGLVAQIKNKKVILIPENGKWAYEATIENRIYYGKINKSQEYELLAWLKDEGPLP